MNSNIISYMSILSEAVNDKEATNNPDKVLHEFMTKAKNWITDRLKELKKLGQTTGKVIKDKLDSAKERFKGVQVKLPSSFDKLLNKYLKRCKELSVEPASNEQKLLGETVTNPNEKEDYALMIVEVKEEIKKNPDKKGFRSFRLDKLVAPLFTLFNFAIKCVTTTIKTLQHGMSELRKNPKEVFSNIKDRFSVLHRQISAQFKHIKIGFNIFNLGKKN